jgi:hypothetical protein
MTEGLSEHAILGKSKADFYKDLDSMEKTFHHDGFTEHGDRLQQPRIDGRHFHGKDGVSNGFHERKLLSAMLRAAKQAFEQHGSDGANFRDRLRAAAKAAETERNEHIAHGLPVHVADNVRNLVAKVTLPQEKKRDAFRGTPNFAWMRDRKLNQDQCKPDIHGNNERSCLKGVTRQYNQQIGQEVDVDECNTCVQPGQKCYNPSTKDNKHPACSDSMTLCWTMNKDKSEWGDEEKTAHQEYVDMVQYHKDQGVNLLEVYPFLTDHPCLLPECPAIRDDTDSIENCGRASQAWCCDPASPDCYLLKKSTCTLQGCNRAMEEVDTHQLIQAIISTGKITFNNEEDKWDYFDSIYHKYWKCPFSDKSMCDGSYCGLSYERNGVQRRRFAHELKDTLRLNAELQKPCWRGTCFNGFVKEYCALEERPLIKGSELDGAEIAKMMFTGNMPDATMRATWKDRFGKDLEGSSDICKVGCFDMLDWLTSAGQGSKSQDTMPWPETMKNTLKICESTLKMPQVQGGDAQISGDSSSSGGSDNSWELRACLFDKCNGCFNAEPILTGVKDLTFLLSTSGSQSDSDNDRAQCAFDIAQYAKSPDGLLDTALTKSCEQLARCKKTEANCMCSNADVDKAVGMPLCDKARCLDYQNELVSLYAAKGYFQPGDSWRESFLHARKVLKYKPGQKPTINFDLSPQEEQETEMVTARDKCGIEYAASVKVATQKTIEYCNMPGREHSTLCRGFSPCGDGVVSWGESCDPGPNGDKAWGGCERCEHIKQGFACAEPGKPCDRCVLDNRIQINADDKASACQFCLNKKLKNMTSPCAFPQCQSISTVADANACDGFVSNYCGQLEARGMSDPGCVDYVKQSRRFAVPRLASNCTYKTHTFELNSEYFQKEKVAIITCDFVDITGTYNDTTPLFWHVSPTTPIKLSSGYMFSPPKGDAAALLKDYEVVRGTGGFFPITDLRLEDFYEYQNANIKSASGNPLEQWTARKMPWFSTLSIEAPTSNWNLPDRPPCPNGQTWCNQHEDPKQYKKNCDLNRNNDYDLLQPFDNSRNFIPMIPLPPCDDPIGWAAKAKALEYKFIGTNERLPHSVHQQDRYASEQAYKPLKDLDPSKFDTSCVPRKNRYVAMVSLSKAIDQKECRGDGCGNHHQSRGQTTVFTTVKTSVRAPLGDGCSGHIDQWCCKRCFSDEFPQEKSSQWCQQCSEREENKNCCAAYLANTPISLEEALEKGIAKMQFGNRLYQKGCSDYQCLFKVEHCEAVGISPGFNFANVSKLDMASDAVVTNIQKLDKARSWSELTQSFMEVSAAAESTPYSDAVKLFQKLVTVKKETTTIKGMEGYCMHDFWDYDFKNLSKSWSEDPCCNYELRDSKCCKGKDVPGKEIEVVGSAKDGPVRTFCRNPNKVKFVLQDINENLKNGRQCAANLDKEVGKDALDKLWEFEKTCKDKIGMADQSWNAPTCTSDSDCFCSYATCEDGKCAAPYDYMGECFAQCFQQTADQKIVSIVKDMWNVSFTAADADQDFERKFVEKMTEPTCVGPDRWRDGIGRNERRWHENVTCMKTWQCSSHDILHSYHRECWDREVGDHNSKNLYCSPWSNKQSCEKASGFIPGMVTKWKCNQKNDDGTCQWGECGISGVQTPCGCDDCYKPCRFEEDCAKNGTWFYRTTMPDGTNSSGSCCPRHGFVHTRESKDEATQKTTIYRECKAYSQGSAPGHFIRGESCCLAAGGKYRTGTYGGQCCMGNWRTECDFRGECHTHCEEHVDMWRTCQECAQKKCKDSECSKCNRERSKCWQYTKFYANKTKCLEYKQCNDNRITQQINGQGDKPQRGEKCGAKSSDGAGGAALDPKDSTAFCSECHGSNCYRMTEGAQCIIRSRGATDIPDYSSSSSNSDCASLGRTWWQFSKNRYRCIDPAATTAWDCFRRNIQDSVVTESEAQRACPKPDELDDWQKNEFKRATGIAWSSSNALHKPANYYGEKSCDRSCYFAKPDSGSQCKKDGNGASADDSWFQTDRAANGNGACRSWKAAAIADQAGCVTHGGTDAVLVKNRVQWRPARYSTQAECDNGKCLGSLQNTNHWAGWTKAQCETLSTASCNRWCERCESGENAKWKTVTNGEQYKYRWSGHGVCFKGDTSSELVEEVQTVTTSGTSALGGTFTLTVKNGDIVAESAAIAHNAEASEVQTKLNALSNLGRIDCVVVTRGSLTSNGYPYQITFKKTCILGDVADITVDKTSLTGSGANIAVVETNKGVAYEYDRSKTSADTCTGGTLDWVTCLDRPWNISCTDSTWRHYNELQCRQHNWERCPTQEMCENVGDCDGAWEFGRARKCNDVGWTHGERHWVNTWKQVDTTVTQNQVTFNVSYIQHKHTSCSDRRESNGVCVKGRNSDGGCDKIYQVHPKGCLAEGFYKNKAGCTGAGHAWYNELKSKTACLAVTGCKEKFNPHFTAKLGAKCTGCSGTEKSRYRWRGGLWKGGTVKTLKWNANGVELAPSNQWVNSISTDRMKETLEKAIMRAFAEKKKTQSLLMFNYFSKSLRMIACDCGRENRTDCWEGMKLNSTALMGEGESFCNDNEDSIIQGGCEPVSITKKCSSSSNRRRLLASGGSSSKASVSFEHVSMGTFSTKITENANPSNAAESVCTKTDRLDALQIKNSKGTVIGQLIGDGQGVKASGGTTFDAVKICLRYRTDIRIFGTAAIGASNVGDATDKLFDKYDVARRGSDGQFEPLSITTWEESPTASKMCIKVTSVGVYFPIIKADSAGANDECSPAISATGGICIRNAAGQEARRCFCGFYGDKCHLGCPNSCSGVGTCDENTNECTCNAKRIGADCSQADCPRDGDGYFCSQHGDCLADATCKCVSEWEGKACDKAVILERPASFGFGASALAGMAQMFLGQFGINIPLPPELIAFMVWMCFLSPCWLCGCVLFAPCCCRKQQCLCWGNGICGCRCCHSHVEGKVVKLQRQASKKLGLDVVNPSLQDDSAPGIEMYTNPSPGQGVLSK